jgi:hypothetical protein
MGANLEQTAGTHMTSCLSIRVCRSCSSSCRSSASSARDSASAPSLRRRSTDWYERACSTLLVRAGVPGSPAADAADVDDQRPPANGEEGGGAALPSPSPPAMQGQPRDQSEQSAERLSPQSTQGANPQGCRRRRLRAPSARCAHRWRSWDRKNIET